MIKIEQAQAANEARQTAVLPIVPRWMRPAVAAKYCGVSRSSLYTEMSEGRVKSYRVGGSRLLDREELDSFILRNQVNLPSAPAPESTT